MSSVLVQRRTHFPKLTTWVLAMTVAILAVGCDKGGDVTTILAEARTAAFQGKVDEAVASYERVLEIEPGNVSALLGLADIEIQEGDLAAAQIRFETLDTLELIPSDQQRVDQSRNRLWELIYEESKGDGPVNPSDPEQYENAIISLYNAEPSEARALEISQRFVYLARGALGAEDVTIPMIQNQTLLEAATIDQIRAALEAYQRLTSRDSRLLRVLLTDEEIQFGWLISGWRGSHIMGGYTYELERYEGIDFKRKSFRTVISSEPLSWFTGIISFSFGDGIYYDENPYLGYKTSYGFRATFKPLTNLLIYYDFNNDKFYKTKGGERVYSINIISQRLTYQLSRTISLRLITDYNDYDKELYNSVLLSYELRPGTVFYLGIDDNQEKDDSGIFRNQGRYYFIKFSYWWRI